MMQTVSRILIGMLLVLPFWSRPAAAQSEEDLRMLRQEVETLKEGQKRIEKELEVIKNVLRGMLAAQAPGREAPQPFKPVVVSVEGSPFKGDKNAKVTLVDFTDYQ